MQVFGEWRYNFIIYVIMLMQLHLWHIVNRLSPNTISTTYVIVKSLQDELFNYCMTFAYEYSKCFIFYVS